MNTNRLVGHIVGSVVFTALWEAAISLPAGSPGWRLIALGALPQAVAGISVALQEVADRPENRRLAVEPLLHGEITRQPARPALTGRR